MLLDPIRYLLHKTISPRLEYITDLLIHRNKNRESGKMRQQTNIFEMKDQDKNPKEELSEVEISILPNKEFKVIEMLNKLGRKMDDHSE